MKSSIHPLAGYPEDQKIDYLSIVASIATADGDVTEDEISQLRTFCSAVEIGGVGIGLIISTMEAPSIFDVRTALARLSQTELRFTLVTDMLFMAYADGIYSPEEEREIHDIARRLHISDTQLLSMNDYVQTVLAAQEADAETEDWQQRGRHIATELTSNDIPLSAVVLSGAVTGLGVQGISAGLSALGLGLGIVPGIGMALSVGFCSYWGVRWLFKKVYAEGVDD